MAEARRMTKSELFTHFAERFGIKRAEAGEFFDELQQLTEQELLRCGEFVLPGDREAGVAAAREAYGPQPGDRCAGRGPGQAGGQGAHREAAQGRGRSVAAVTPHAFITKWRASALKERSASQEHFIDLCRLQKEPTPAEAGRS